MQLKYGSYAHDENEVFLSISKDAITTDGGAQIGYTTNVVINGRLQGSTQAELTTAINALETAYAVNGRDLVLLDNSGADSAFVIRSRETQGGTMVVRPPQYPDLNNAQYTTFVDYTIEVEAEYITNSVLYESYTDTISITGNGGPRIVLQETALGIPIAQTTRQRTVVTATQTGSASRTGSPPLHAAPLFPGNLVNDQQNRAISVTTTDGRRIYTSTWNYQFQSQTSLSAIPFTPL